MCKGFVNSSAYFSCRLNSILSLEYTTNHSHTQQLLRCWRYELYCRSLWRSVCFTTKDELAMLLSSKCSPSFASRFIFCQTSVVCPCILHSGVILSSLWCMRSGEASKQRACWCNILYGRLSEACDCISKQVKASTAGYLSAREASYGQVCFDNPMTWNSRSKWVPPQSLQADKSLPTQPRQR